MAGMAAGDEALSIDIFEELFEMYKRQGAPQDESSEQARFQNAQLQLGELAELMRSYGFPTPGWSNEEDAEGPSGAADMAVDQVCLPTCLPFSFGCSFDSALCIIFAGSKLKLTSETIFGLFPGQSQAPANVLCFVSAASCTV